ncbi:MAG TPA: methyl-accepting chemotaxis protein [Chloroflexia bacterium]|nr:methyl-accepting chemotaxis protein [Chloroflexia bacterium]
MRFSLVQAIQHSKLSVRAKLIGGFLTIALFLLVLTILSVLIIGDLGNKINQVATTKDQKAQAALLDHSIDELTNSLDDFSSIVKDITPLLLNEQKGNTGPVPANQPTPPFLNDYSSKKEDLLKTGENIIAAYQNTKGLPKQKGLEQSWVMQQQGMQHAQSLYSLVDSKFQNLLNPLDEMVAAFTNHQPETALAKAEEASKALAGARDTVSQFNQELDKLTKAVDAESNQVLDDANSARNIWQWVLLAVGLIALSLAVAFGITLTYVFTSPVERLRRRLVKLADGDLESKLIVPNRDQFGELASTFNQSIGRLGEMVEQVQEQAVKVSSAAAQISTASNQSASATIEQAGAVAQATVTMEELSHTAQQIAEAASAVAIAAEQTLDSASEGQETVKESINGINSLKNQVRNITDRILALSERSQRVGHIIDQVASIADQTHLLALNAAIESAGAGEHGKRFAVVAANVKQLAERSRQATKDVQAVLEEIQAATNASVMATEQGMKEAERGVMLAHRTGEANESIILMVERTVQLASGISLATQQQRSASEQVVTSMRELAGVIQEAAASARQSSALATSLDEIAWELRRLTSHFRITGNLPLTDNTTLSNKTKSNRNGHSADGGGLEEESLAATTPFYL